MWTILRITIAAVGLGLYACILIFNKNEFRPLAHYLLGGMILLVGIIELRAKRKDSAMMYFTVLSIMVLLEIF